MSKLMFPVSSINPTYGTNPVKVYSVYPEYISPNSPVSSLVAINSFPVTSF